MLDFNVIRTVGEKYQIGKTGTIIISAQSPWYKTKRIESVLQRDIVDAEIESDKMKLEILKIKIFDSCNDKVCTKENNFRPLRHRPINFSFLD